MDEAKAREILKRLFNESGELDCSNPWVELMPHSKVELDGRFSVDELEAIVWWMRNKI